MLGDALLPCVKHYKHLGKYNTCSITLGSFRAMFWVVKFLALTSSPSSPKFPLPSCWPLPTCGMISPIIVCDPWILCTTGYSGLFSLAGGQSTRQTSPINNSRSNTLTKMFLLVLGAADYVYIPGSFVLLPPSLCICWLRLVNMTSHMVLSWGGTFISCGPVIASQWNSE